MRKIKQYVVLKGNIGGQSAANAEIHCWRQNCILNF